MISNDRISRRQRLKSLRDYKAGIALSLAIVLLLLVVGTTYRTQLENLLGKSSIVSIFRKRGSGNADSLIIRTGNGFRLNKLPQVDTLFQDTTGIGLIRIFQPWPSGLPLEFYARELQALSGEAGIDCDCVVFKGNDSLVCEMRSGHETPAKVIVIPDKRTGLAGRSLGIIMENIYELENREITEIVHSKFPFGYLAAADVFPAGDLRTQLRSEWVTSLLTISVSRKDLVSYDLLKGKSESNYRDSASDLLKRHPNLAFLKFERSEDIDYSFVEALIDRAKEAKIGYIYENDVPDRIDSLAFSAGLTFITPAGIVDYTEKEFNDIQAELINRLAYSESPRNLIITVDISEIKVQKMVDLIRYLKKIGINVISIDKLTAHPEFTIEDL